MSESTWLSREVHYHVAFLIALSILLYFVGLDVRDLWDIDEGMHAAIAQTMLHSGDWVTPSFNGAPFLDKPPMFTWLVAGSFLLFGMTEIAARLPAAMAGLGTVLVTYALARKLYGPRTGLIAGIVLATSFEVAILARVVQYDVPLMFFVSLALYFYVCQWQQPARSTLPAILFWTACALATLTKGPIGAVIPGIAIAGHALAQRDMYTLRRLLHPAGLLLYVAILAPWFVLKEKAVPGYLRYFIVEQHFANVLGEVGDINARHPEPWYYFLPVLFGGLLPWSLMLPQAITQAMTIKRSPESWFLVAWLVGGVVLFSLAASKLASYLMPLFPAAAILVARYWDQVLRGLDGRSGLLIGSGILTLALGAFATWTVVTDPWSYWEFRSGIGWAAFERFIVLATLLFLLVTGLVYLRKLPAALVAMASVVPVVMGYLVFVLVPGTNGYKSAKDIAACIDSILPPGEPIVMYQNVFDSAMFYTGRDAVVLKSEQQLCDYLATDDLRFVLVRSRARRADEAFNGEYEIMTIVGNKAIVSNHEASDALFEQLNKAGRRSSRVRSAEGCISPGIRWRRRTSSDACNGATGN